MLGEASINPGNGILYYDSSRFPLPRRMGNAERDMKIIVEYLGLEYDESQFLADLT